MRFFDFNYAFKGFSNTYDASSNTSLAVSAFDEKKTTNWESTGEGTNGDSIYLDCDYGTSFSTDTAFIRNTNISDATVELWTGASWVTPSNYSSIVSTKGFLFSYWITYDSTSHSKIRVIGSNTTPSNEEKRIQEVYSFSNIGKLNIPPSDINVKRKKIQYKNELIDGKFQLFIQGNGIEIDLKLKAHYNQADITLLNHTLFNRDLEFYVWINDNEEQYMNVLFEPFRFEDIVKVGVDEGDQPTYYKNLFFSGMDNKIKLIEVS